jgi:hypothetical protein
MFLIDKRLSTTRRDEKPFRGSYNYQPRWNVMIRFESALHTDTRELRIWVQGLDTTSFKAERY